MVADASGMIHLFSVDGKTNPKLQSLKLESYSLNRARFDGDNEIIISSRFHCGYFYRYDIHKGSVMKVSFRNGKSNYALFGFDQSPDGKYLASRAKDNRRFAIMCKQTNECISEQTVNGDIKSLLFSPDSEKLFCNGSGGRVYVFDMRKKSFCHSFEDRGCINGTAIAISPNERYLATGSATGEVNIYDYSSTLTSSEPKPLKTLYNIKSLINNIRFNHTSELMVMSSCNESNAVRAVHFPSMTAFSNFPLPNYKHGFVKEINFSPHTKYLAMGNDNGLALLNRLFHFEHY